MDENFKQLCVLSGVIVGEEHVEDFEKFFLNDMGVRVKYLCELQTNPDKGENKKDVPGTGGRNDTMFYIHKDDVSNFAVKRMGMGIRWWEDVVKYNDNSHLYSKEFLNTHPPTW